jgi:HemX protein
MNNVMQIMSYSLLVLYLITFISYFYDFFADNKYLQNIKRLALFFTLLFHVVYFVERTFFLGHLPIVTQYEIFSLIAFSISFTYFLLELLSDIKGTGVFILLFAIIFQTKSTLFIQDIYVVNHVLQNYPLGTHVITAILGFTAISISSAYSFMYLLLYRNLKSNNFSIIFKRLPNLEILELLTLHAMGIGFVLLSIAVILGLVWLPSAFPDFSYLDSKIISTITVTIIYGIAILLKMKRIVVGKRFAKFSIYGFIFSLLSLMLTSVIMDSFHNFSN